MAEFGGGCGGGTVRVVIVRGGHRTDLGCYNLPSSMDGMVTFINKEPTIQGSADELLRMIYGSLPQGQYYQIGKDENGKNYVYSAITVPGLGEVPIATYENTEDGIIRTPNAASQDWEVIKQILRSQGYSDTEINSIEDSLHKDGSGNFCHTLTTFVEGCEFRGSTTLANILGEIGFDGGWWDVRPGVGTDCTTDDGKEGTVTVEDGSEYCKENPVKNPGDPCTGPHGSQGEYDENGDCQFVVGADCMKGTVPGTIDANGDCSPNDDDGGTDDEGTFEDYVNEVGEDVANAAKDIYNEMKDVLTECVGSPLECIKKIGDVIAGEGIPEKCKGLVSCDIAKPDEGTYCWKDCVNFQVLVGLPIPIPSLPGMQDIGTYRDFEDFLKGIGKSIEDFFEDPAGTLEDWVKGIIDKIKGVFSDAQDVDASAIIDWLKGIFGAAVGAWVWGQIEDELSAVFPFTTIDDNCEEIDDTNADECGYKKCGDGFIKKYEVCGDYDNNDCREGVYDEAREACICGDETGNPGMPEDPDGSCDGPEGPDCLSGITADNAEDCGYKDCNGKFIPAEQKCEDSGVDCER